MCYNVGFLIILSGASEMAERVRMLAEFSLWDPWDGGQEVPASYPLTSKHMHTYDK